MAVALGKFVADASVDPSRRTKAAWLLKDMCNPASVPSLEYALLAEDAGDELRVQILDTLERLAFAGRLPARISDAWLRRCQAEARGGNS